MGRSSCMTDLRFVADDGGDGFRRIVSWVLLFSLSLSLLLLCPVGGQMTMSDQRQA